MTVVGPDGNLFWSTGPVSIQGAVAGVELRPLGPDGQLHRQLPGQDPSADGHVVSGSWWFFD